MSFTGSIQTVLRQYATFRGRAGRPEFWWWYLFTILVNVATSVFDRLTAATLGVSFLSAVVSLGLLVPTLAVSVRRLHDSNLSGWWLLAPIGIGLVGCGLGIAGVFSTVASVFDPNASQGIGLAVGLFLGAGLLLLASFILSLVLMLRGSTPGPNRFGPYPGPTSPYPPTGGYGYPAPYDPRSTGPW